MKSTTAILALVATLALGACASAPPAANAPSASGPAAKAEAAPAPKAAASRETARLDPNETVCRRQVVTGSRFPETRCQTRYQWEIEQRDARKQTQEHQGSVGTPQT
ncbi:MAG: hypothetical protein AB7P31_04920 [Steroidobacteraceae bacterium]